MPTVQLKENNNAKKDELSQGFLGGLNTFQDENLLKDNELTRAKNIILTVDGIEPRPGIVHYGSDNSESRVFGLFAYYRSNGTRELLRMSGGKLYKYTTGTWTQIGSTTWNATARAYFVQARDIVYIFNGVDPLRFYNGSTITTYSALSAPSPAITVVGTAGTTAYSYRVSAVNAVGETLASTPVTTATGNATLSASNHNKLTWSAVSGAVSYNIYGRKSTGLGETYMATVYVLEYLDTGIDSPSLAILPPLANSTEGIISKKAVFALSRIFTAGDPANPSRLYYGGVGTNVGNFSFSEIGGGATDIQLNDGQQIRDILPFQGGVIVWKDQSIYKFSFLNDGSPQVEEITRSFGGIAWRGSQHVENDVIFPTLKDGRLAFYSLGNQENYSAGVLRTNELSIKVAKGKENGLENVNPAQLANAASFYFGNIFGCAVATTDNTTNNRIWCLDTRFGAWTHWDDLSPNCFTVWSDTSQEDKLYYGSDTTGYVEQMFTASKTDNGTAITYDFATKSFNFKRFNKYKLIYDPTFQFKEVVGSVTVNVDLIIDGVVVVKTVPLLIAQTNTGGGGAGVFIPGQHLAGDAPGFVTSLIGVSSDTWALINLYGLECRAIKYRMRGSVNGTSFKFLAVAQTYKMLEGYQLNSANRSYL